MLVGRREPLISESSLVSMVSPLPRPNTEIDFRVPGVDFGVADLDVDLDPDTGVEGTVISPVEDVSSSAMV